MTRVATNKISAQYVRRCWDTDYHSSGNIVLPFLHWTRTFFGDAQAPLSGDFLSDSAREQTLLFIELGYARKSGRVPLFRELFPQFLCPMSSRK